MKTGAWFPAAAATRLRHGRRPRSPDGGTVLKAIGVTPLSANGSGDLASTSLNADAARSRAERVATHVGVLVPDGAATMRA